MPTASARKRRWRVALSILGVAALATVGFAAWLYVATPCLNGFACPVGQDLAIPKVLPPVKVEPPVQTVLDWMQAMDRHDYPLTLAHLAPADRSLMYGWGKSDFDTTLFTHLHCSLGWEQPVAYGSDGSPTSFEAFVGCSFVSQDPATGPMYGWSVDLTSKPGGAWLITSYGQG